MQDRQPTISIDDIKNKINWDISLHQQEEQCLEALYLFYQSNINSPLEEKANNDLIMLVEDLKSALHEQNISAYDKLLFLAAKQLDAAMLQWLLVDKGANANKVDREQCTALMLFLQNAALPDNKKKFDTFPREVLFNLITSSDVTLSDADGNTALHYAARLGDEEIFEAILQRIPGFITFDLMPKNNRDQNPSEYSSQASEITRWTKEEYERRGELLANLMASIEYGDVEGLKEADLTEAEWTEKFLLGGGEEEDESEDDSEEEYESEDEDEDDREDEETCLLAYALKCKQQNILDFLYQKYLETSDPDAAPHLAAKFNQAEDKFATFVAARISLDTLNSEQQTPLMLALSYDNKQAILGLLAQGADPYLSLCLAIEQDQSKLAYRLLECVGINTQDRYGQSFLMRMINDYHTQGIKFLLNTFIDLNLINTTGSTALMQILKKMQELENDKETENLGVAKQTYQKYKKFAQTLISQSNLSLRDQSGHSALHYAAQLDEPELFKSLFTQMYPALHKQSQDYAAASAEDRLRFDLSAKIFANTWKSQEFDLIFALLKDESAYPSKKLQNKYTQALVEILQTPAAEQYPELSEIALLLVKKGADVHAVHKNNSLLNMALSNGYEAVAWKLLKRKAATHIIDQNGNTTLHLAAQTGNLALFASLVPSATSLDSKNRQRKSALKLVDEHNGFTGEQKEIARLLVCTEFQDRKIQERRKKLARYSFWYWLFRIDSEKSIQASVAENKVSKQELANLARDNNIQLPARYPGKAISLTDALNDSSPKQIKQALRRRADIDKAAMTTALLQAATHNDLFSFELLLKNDAPLDIEVEKDKRVQDLLQPQEHAEFLLLVHIEKVEKWIIEREAQQTPKRFFWCFAAKDTKDTELALARTYLQYLKDQLPTLLDASAKVAKGREGVEVQKQQGVNIHVWDVAIAAKNPFAEINFNPESCFREQDKKVLQQSSLKRLVKEASTLKCTK